MLEYYYGYMSSLITGYPCTQLIVITIAEFE
jgi:hypothetical protein